MVNPINNLNVFNYTNIREKSLETEQGEFEKILERAFEEKDEKKLKKACNDLEALFVGMMFKQMRNTVQKGDLFNGGFAEEMYEDMLFDRYSEEISNHSGMGLGDMLYRQLSKNMKRESEGDNVE